jgi:hypothetical protein
MNPTNGRWPHRHPVRDRRRGKGREGRKVGRAGWLRWRASDPFLSLELRRPDRTSAGDVSQLKPLALLAFLAAAPNDSFHRRDALVGLFWPELD